MPSLGPLLRNLLRRSRMEEEMSDELRFHIDSRVEHLVRSGSSRTEAERQARIEFGAMESYKERCREANGLAILDELRANLRYTFRALRANPGFTAASVLSLAIGIGLNTSAFTFVSSLVLHPFPFPEVDRVATLWEVNAKTTDQRQLAAPANFLDWKQNSRSFEHMAAYRPWDSTLTGVDDPEPIKGAQVSADYFKALGIPPLLGRVISASDCQPGQDAAVVVSYGFWKSRLSGSPGAIGTDISLAGRSFTVAGVMPENFNYPLETEVWAPLVFSPQDRVTRNQASLAVLARLRPGVEIGQANAEMNAISSELERRYPQTNAGRGVSVKTLREVTDQVTKSFVTILLWAATFVLLLACANVANLFLARSTARQKEISLRTALGASRWRIARELLTESLVIAILGGALGLVLARWDLLFTKSAIPEQVYQWEPGLRSIHIDAWTMAVCVALCLLAGVCCSLPAQFQLLRGQGQIGLNEALKDGGRGSSSGSARNRARSTLVVIEVALSLVLMVGAGIMVRTFERMLGVDLGYDPRNVLSMEMTPSPSNYRDQRQLAQLYEQVVRGLNTIPGATAAASGGLGPASKFAIEGREEPRPGEPRPLISGVTAGYLPAMRIALLAGRGVSAADGPDTQRVVVLSQMMASHYWPGSNAIGHQIRFSPQSPWLTVVGVCGDLKEWFDGKPQPAAYLPIAQAPPTEVRLLIRTASDPSAMAGAARAQIRAVDRNQPVYDVKTMETRLTEETSGVRMAAERMSIYAGISLLLALVGCYAVAAFSASRRTQEIGIRMTLGATRQTILRMVLTQSARLTLIGLSIGLLLAIGLTRLMAQALFNVVAVEPLTFVILTSVLAVTALAAGSVPAYRASCIDPVTALRTE